MTILRLVLPYCISTLLGFLAVRVLLFKSTAREPWVIFFLALGLGLGISAFLTFGSFLILDRFSRTFVVVAHLLTLAGLGFFYQILVRSNQPLFPIRLTFKLRQPKLLGLQALILLASLPLLLQYKIYPYGGWDAWQVWNFKAKVLFLGGHTWRNLFLPELWQTSPHYPLLLPAMNVWGWTFMNEPGQVTPFITSVIFTYATAGLLFSALWQLTKRWEMIVAPLLLLASPFFGLLATSQYCDIEIGYLMLAAVFCLVVAQQKDNPGYASLAGLSAGLLAFCKPEATLAAVMLGGLGAAHLYFAGRMTGSNPKIKRNALYLGASLAVSLIPSAIFYLFCSPGNQSFYNGLTDLAHPTSLDRVKAVFIFLAAEITAKHWNALWILLGAGLLVAGRRAIPGKQLIPSFILTYLAVIILYYITNTYFEILWWLSVTLNRILFSLAPLVVFWGFWGVGEEDNK